MIKFKGAVSGLAGGMVACLFGVAFLWRILYLRDVVVAVFQGEKSAEPTGHFTLWNKLGDFY
jgi:hypothetical protein